MPSMRDIKRRKVSIQSTQQITKAMKLVSTVKLQRAKSKAERIHAYFNCMYQTVNSMLERSGNIDHPFMKPKVGHTVIGIAVQNGHCQGTSRINRSIGNRN